MQWQLKWQWKETTATQNIDTTARKAIKTGACTCMKSEGRHMILWWKHLRNMADLWSCWCRFSHVEISVTHSVCCMQKIIYCSLTSHVPPVEQPMKSQEVNQDYKCGRRHSICSACETLGSTSSTCAPMWNTRSWTTLFRPTVVPNSAQTQLRDWRHSFCLVCRRLWVWSPEPPHKLHVWNPTTQELEAGG